MQSPNLKANLIFLFEQLGYMFGHKFTSTYGETAVDEDGQLTGAGRTWSAALSDLTHEQLVNGMRACKDSGEEWPPSIPSFVAMCKGTATNEFGLDYIPQYHRETKRERLIESDENKAKHKAAYKSGMDGLKNILKR